MHPGLHVCVFVCACVFVYVTLISASAEAVHKAHCKPSVGNQQKGGILGFSFNRKLSLFQSVDHVRHNRGTFENWDFFFLSPFSFAFYQLVFSPLLSGVVTEETLAKVSTFENAHNRELTGTDKYLKRLTEHCRITVRSLDLGYMVVCREISSTQQQHGKR